MICQRCHRHFRSSAAGLRCSTCASSYHVKCLSNFDKDVNESGDRKPPWKCAICQTVASYDSTISKDDLFNAISALSEKFELVNKIQLPKLNGELAQLKCLSDRISKQNEDILRKISELENKRSQEKRPSASSSGNKASRTHRRRSLSLTHRHNGSRPHETIEYTPIINPEKAVRYRLRRRSYSYVLSRMLHLLNRKLNRNKMTYRKRHRGAVHVGF